MTKSDIDKAINFLQIYRIDGEVVHLYTAKRLILKTIKSKEKDLKGFLHFFY